MKIPVVYLNFNKEASTSDYWDMQLIKDMFAGELWKPVQGFEFESIEYPFGEIKKPLEGKGAVVVIPARHNISHVNEVQAFINQLEWCVLMLCGDEERLFDYKKLKHPNMKVWLMQPKPDDEADVYIGSGYTPHTRGVHKDFDKPLDWVFAGQKNHVRRELCMTELDRLKNRDDWKYYYKATEGFTQGIDRKTYTSLMAQAKAVPCPSGIASPDSFRVYEALELGCVPIADDLALNWEQSGYWHKVFTDEDVPFKILTGYADLEGYLGDIIRDYPHFNNKVFAWWQGYKRKLVYKLRDQIAEFIGYTFTSDKDFERDKITIIILTSPIAKHPSTEIIDQTIRDMRAVLPDCEIIIGIDGVRAEQEDYRERYELYKQHLLYKCNNEWSNVLPVVFEEHMHQAAMTRQLLKLVRTETIMFVEHDTALSPDFEYDWKKFVGAIELGLAYTIRFHFEAQIPEPHKYLMIGEVEDVNGLPMLKTAQWSQRPHLSSTTFYRDMMNRYFTDESRTMIEDKIHGHPSNAYLQDGLQGWYLWRLWIYHPDGHIKRSYTSDGRGNDPKYEMRF